MNIRKVTSGDVLQHTVGVREMMAETPSFKVTAFRNLRQSAASRNRTGFQSRSRVRGSLQ